MLSLSERALGPESSVNDKVTFMTSVAYLHTLETESNEEFVKQIKNLIANPSSMLQGLYMLEFALLQNPDIYVKCHWTRPLLNIIKDTASSECKAKCCKILGVIVSILSKDPRGNKEEATQLGSELFELMVNFAGSDCEWREAAFECISTSIKLFPAGFYDQKEKIINIILERMNIVSYKSFEMYADCFCYIPFIQHTFELRTFEENWLNQYHVALNTMILILHNLLPFMKNEEKNKIEEQHTYVFHDDDAASDDFENRMIQVRRFINLCRCLTKMLSTNSKYEVEVPVRETLYCIDKLFLVDEIVKLDANSMENQILLSTLSQIQIACLGLMEPLLTNFDTQIYSALLCHLIMCALQASTLSNISNEPISQLRHVVWKLLATWIECRGSKVTYDIIHNTCILKELLSDISIQDECHETNEPLSPSKTKKSAPQNGVKKNNCVNKNWCAVCKGALKALKRLVYSGSTFFSKSISEEILSTVVNIAYAIQPTNDFPFPYTDERCRKSVYDVLLALTVVCNPDQAETLMFVIPVFTSAMRDPSNKVTALCYKAAATCRLALHPKKPPPLIIEPDRKPNLSDISIANEKFPLWQMEEIYGEKHPNLQEMSSEPENRQISQTFNNESDMHSSDYSQVETHYSEATGSQCNGDEMYETASQCQDSSEEDEEDGEEEDEDEDERSFDEDMNPEIMHPEIVIPADETFVPTAGELQIMTPPVHIINPETSHQNDEPELEELRPCSKPQANEPSNSNNKNIQNGVPDPVPDKEMPSSSTQNTANENGIYGSEDEDMEDDDDDVEEEEEDEEATYIAEKRVPEFIEPASKKPKLEAGAEVKNETKNDATGSKAKSPTLEEMKADFVFSDGEDVQS